MSDLPKYKNLEQQLPQLQDVLLSSLQSEFLEIKKVRKECEKFQSIAQKYPELLKSEYVIFSKFVKKGDHQHETFIFIDAQGAAVAHISGRDLELYGMLEGCDLEVNEEFLCSWHHQEEAL